MHYVAVAPLAVSRRDTYTYRADARLPAGSLVSIPYAGRQSSGVVAGPAEADERAKVATPTEERIPEWQLRFAQGLAKAYLAPLGQTLGLCLPKWRESLAPEIATAEAKPAVALQANPPTVASSERQTLVLVPERAMLRRFANEGLCFSATLPIAKRRGIWEQVRTGAAAIVFGTRSALFLPWQQLTEIIVLHEDELGHQNERTPRFHAREAAYLLAQAHAARLTLTSPAPSPRAWTMAGRPTFDAAEIPAPTLVTLKQERFEDPLPHGLVERLTDQPGSIFLHTVQQNVRPVREAIKAAGLVRVTVGGQSTVLADKPYDNVITIGVDAILARPGYAVTERAIALLRKLGGLVKPGGTFLVYSKHQDHPVFGVLDRPYAAFLEAECSERKALSLPPAKPLVRISTDETDRRNIERAVEQLGMARRDVRYSSDSSVLHVLIKGDPGRLRALIKPERRISVEY